MAEEEDAVIDGLVAAATAGDGEAFAQLLTPYRSRLFAYLARDTGRREDAEELMQETLLRAWQGMAGYRHAGRFDAWLFAIARNVARDARRLQARHRAAFVSERPGDVAEPRVDPVAPIRLEARARARRLEALLAGLPAERRQVFLLRQHGELSFREIAELMGRPLGTVLSHMHRAVHDLRRGWIDDER